MSVVLAEGVTSSTLELPVEEGESLGEVGEELEKLIQEASDLDPKEKESLEAMLKHCRKAFTFPVSEWEKPRCPKDVRSILEFRS